MRRDDDAFRSAYALADVANQFAKFGGDGVADGVGNVQRGGADFDDGFEHLEQEFRVGAGCVFGREFNVVAECPRQADRVARLIERLLPGNAQLAASECRRSARKT